MEACAWWTAKLNRAASHRRATPKYSEHVHQAWRRRKSKSIKHGGGGRRGRGGEGGRLKSQWDNNQRFLRELALHTHATSRHLAVTGGLPGHAATPPSPYVTP
ncbi:hypothetical protein E2C01_094071 [Portunus trituberculatus]|uniref:Uncharacterized protein n=1 Tax=Portunus trituberculatus TaxID=210409 RepID=A0A5B7JKR7_PORTR|nr:hypothetical protein [Portunus trituberculatus]